MHTQSVAAATWWAQSRGATSAEWIANYKQSLKARHRDVISEIVGGLPGATSMLEVGCHCGPNLIRLATDHPTLEQLSGVDVSAEAVTAGNGWAETLGLSERIQIVQGRIPEATSNLVDRCVDVVLSCYALAYVAPQDLDAVLYEMGRLARRAVILVEPTTEQAQAVYNGAVSGYSEWAHNYQAASQWIGSWRGTERRIVPIEPRVQKLASALVASR